MTESNRIKEEISQLYKEIHKEVSRCFLNQDSSYKRYAKKIFQTYHGKSISEDDIEAPIFFNSNKRSNAEDVGNQPTILIDANRESDILRVTKNMQRREDGRIFPKDGMVLLNEIFALIAIFNKMKDKWQSNKKEPLNSLLNTEEMKERAKNLAKQFSSSKEADENKQNLNELYTSLASRIEILEDKFKKWEEKNESLYSIG